MKPGDEVCVRNIFGNWVFVGIVEIISVCGRYVRVRRKWGKRYRTRVYYKKDL